MAVRLYVWLYVILNVWLDVWLYVWQCTAEDLKNLGLLKMGQHIKLRGLVCSLNPKPSASSRWASTSSFVVWYEE